MARAEERSWGELRVGIAVTAIAALAIVGVVIAGAQRGPFLPDTYTLYLRLDDAGGIRAASPVRVGGVPAGEVVGLEIVPAREAPPPFASDTLLPMRPEELDYRDIRIELAIQERYRSFVTPSSRAQLASIGMGGERYVQISAGDVREEPLEPGSEVAAAPSVDWDLIIARLNRAFNEIEEIAAISTEIRAKLATGRGTLPRLLADDAALRGRIARFRAESQGLMTLLETGPGLVPRAGHDPTVTALLDSLWRRAERVDRAFEEGSAGRWVEREELDVALAALEAETAELAAALDGGRGTLGRLLHDEELFVQIRVLQRRIGEFVEAFKADPWGFVDIDLF